MVRQTLVFPALARLHCHMAHSVLVVEDDPRFRDAFAKAVSGDSGLCLAGVASDLPQALKLLDALQPNVLLLDLQLPSGNGIDLIRHASAHLPHCHSMVVTVFGDDESVLQCIKAGATGYLLKDARDVDIVQQIHLLCAGGSPISPAIARRLLKWVGGPAEPEKKADVAKIGLSVQECSVLRLSAKGYNYEEIAGLMHLSHHTVETYVKRIYRKLHVHSKTEAIYEARHMGLVDD